MALIVQVNTYIASKELGCINNPNASYYDPITGVNLGPGNPKSSDLSSFSSNDLVNISNAVAQGTLALVSGSLPSATYQSSSYSLFATGGYAGGPGWSGITGVSAAQPSEDGVVRSF